MCWNALSSLLLTDMPAVLPLTAANLRANRAALAAVDVRCATAPLLWSPERETVLRARRAEVAQGWGDKYVGRVHAKGKMTTRERLEQLADSPADIFEVGTFANWGVTFGAVSYTHLTLPTILLV